MGRKKAESAGREKPAKKTARKPVPPKARKPGDDASEPDQFQQMDGAESTYFKKA